MYRLIQKFHLDRYLSSKLVLLIDSAFRSDRPAGLSAGQESCRDQGHTMGGIGNYTAIAEMAWNQGDSLYGWLDNRILKGIEFNIRYNLSGIMSFPDQMQPWEPTAYTANEEECTFENGKFYQAVSVPSVGKPKAWHPPIEVKCLDRVDGRRKRWNITGLGQAYL